MKILFISNSSYSMFNFRSNLLKSLMLDGHHVVVAAPEDDYTQGLIDMGVEFHALPMDPRGANPFVDGKLIARIWRILRHVRPNIFFTYTIKPVIYGAFVSRVLGIPSVCVITGLGSVFTNQGPVTTIAKLLYRITLRFPAQVWFLNAEDRQAMLESKLVFPETSRILPSEGVDLEHFRPQQSSACREQPAFLYLGRLLREKGVEEFVEAARHLRSKDSNLRFLLLGPIGGDGADAISRKRVSDWEREGLVEYLGTAHDVRPYLNDASCVVLPSYYKEGIPRTLLEASASGLPIITTDNVGCRDVVVDGVSGWLCQCRNAEDLAAKMRNFLELSTQEREEMGKRGREYVSRHFDVDNVINLYRETIQAFAQ